MFNNERITKLEKQIENLNVEMSKLKTKVFEQQSYIIPLGTISSITQNILIMDIDRSFVEPQIGDYVVALNNNGDLCIGGAEIVYTDEYKKVLVAKENWVNLIPELCYGCKLYKLSGANKLDSAEEE